MEAILTLLLPLIEKENEVQERKNDELKLTHNIQREQMDMLKVREEKQLQSGTLSKASTGSSKRKPPKFTNEMETQLEINAVHRDQEE